MDNRDAPDAPYDLGVLFVHGIGQSVQGETLVHFGEPLRAAIERLASVDAADPAGRSRSVDVVSAWLSAPAGEGPARAELHIENIAADPAPATESRPAASRWLLAEAWWAEKFPTPTYAQIVSWSLGVLPATLVAHFDRRFRRIGFAFVRALRGTTAPAAGLLAFVRLLMEGVVVTAVLACTPLLVLAICGLLVLGLAPFETTRKLAASLQRKLAATVGDSYVFMQQRITAATICTSVQERLEWLAARCRRVAIVAHSQGGAIAHRVLRGPVTAPCDLLVTFGSGLAKLAEIERGDTARGQGALWFAAFGALLAALGVALFMALGWHASPGVAGLLQGLVVSFVVLEIGAVALVVAMARVADAASADTPAAGTSTPSSPSSPSSTPTMPTLRSGVRPLRPIAFALCVGAAFALFLAAGTWTWASLWPDAPLAAMLGLGMACAYEGLTAWHGESGRSIDPERQWLRDRALFIQDFEFRNRKLRWYDLYASADPVPNGHLLDDFEPPGLISVPVRNRHSLIGDHTSYWQAKDDFVHRVTRLLLDEAGIAVRPVYAHRAARRRVWRVGWLAAARWVLGLAALVLAAQWLAGSPAWLASLAESLTAPAAPAGPDSSARWGGALRAAAPAIAAFALWTVMFGLLQLAWRRWDRAEVDSYVQRHDYRLGAPGLGWTLAPAILMSGVALLAIDEGTTAAVSLLIAAVLIAGATGTRSARAVLRRLSRSGTADELAELDRANLRPRCARALQARDKVALTSIGRQLEGLDDDLARQALHTAAFDLGHANAAWALGRLHDEAARRLSDAAAKQQQRQLAIDAFVRGAALGDPLSARWAAYALERQGDEPRALELYRRAFELGDAAAAHSVGLQLMKRGLKDEARRVYEDGIRRGDSLCAAFLAGHFEALARDAAGDAATALNRQAAQMYRTAFEMGQVTAARQAGDLLRRIGDIVAARRAYALGTQLRDTSAALRLGKLEQEEEEDLDAAYSAYKSVIRLDTLGADAAEALVGLGAVLEKLGRLNAARGRYREALWIRNGRHASAQAGIALTRLLAPLGHAGRAEGLQALQRASTLSPTLAADTYVAFLKPHETAEIEALTPAQVDGLSANGLVALARLLKYDAPQRARTLLERAFAMDTYSGTAEAAAELHSHLVLAADHEAATRLIEATLARGPYFATQVAELMEQRGASAGAAELRRRL